MVLSHQVGGEFSLKATAQKRELEVGDWCVIVKEKKTLFFLHAAP